LVILTFLLTVVSGVHFAALADSIEADTSILAGWFADLGLEVMVLLNDQVSTLHDGAILSLKLQLGHRASLGNDGLGQGELGRLVSRLATAWELEVFAPIRGQRHVVLAVGGHPHRAVAILGGTLDPPLEVVLGALRGQVVGLVGPIVHWAVNPLLLRLRLGDVVEGAGLWLKELHDGSPLHQQLELSVDI
jgi:hypothetical protein